MTAKTTHDPARSGLLFVNLCNDVPFRGRQAVADGERGRGTGQGAFGLSFFQLFGLAGCGKKKFRGQGRI
jgi:hypothetical protein